MKILFLHGFTSSGQCEIAQTLQTEMEGMAEVIAPDLPLYPEEAITLVGKLCQEHSPQIIVGSSCGAFYAQMYACPQRKVILVNPFFRMSEFSSPMSMGCSASRIRWLTSARYTIASSPMPTSLMVVNQNQCKTF